MVTAQDLFASAMKESFAPALRKAGLQGSGQTFKLPSATHFALLGFQRSTYSDSREVRFTLNLKVVSKQTWYHMRQERPYFPVRPGANVGYGTFEWDKRIGHLLPGGEDKWWRISVEHDNAPAIREVSDVLTKVAVPALRDQLRSDSTASDQK
jgi:hypothetical protein